MVVPQLSMALIQPRLDFARWRREVRDPAEAANTAWRHHGTSHIYVAYQVAPVPAGWAWQAVANHTGTWVTRATWTGPYPSQRDAASAAVELLGDWLSRQAHRDAVTVLDQLTAPSVVAS